MDIKNFDTEHKAFYISIHIYLDSMLRIEKTDTLSLSKIQEYRQNYMNFGNKVIAESEKVTDQYLDCRNPQLKTMYKDTLIESIRLSNLISEFIKNKDDVSATQLMPKYYRLYKSFFVFLSKNPDVLRGENASCMRSKYMKYSNMIRELFFSTIIFYIILLSVGAIFLLPFFFKNDLIRFIGIGIGVIFVFNMFITWTGFCILTINFYKISPNLSSWLCNIIGLIAFSIPVIAYSDNDVRTEESNFLMAKIMSLLFFVILFIPSILEYWYFSWMKDEEWFVSPYNHIYLLIINFLYGTF